MQEIQDMKISNQAFAQSDKWEIIRKFKIIENNKKPVYKYILRCKKCGFEKEVSQSGLYKGNIWCPTCSANDEVGRIYGCLEIIEFVGRTTSNQRQHGGDRMYKCKCTKCGHVFDSKKLSDIRNNTGKCKYCNMPTEDAGINTYLRFYKDGAKSRGYDFELTPEEFTSIIKKDCFYCGKSPREHKFIAKSLSKNEYTIVANGIDRFDNTLGYTSNNCVPCCTECNWMKRNLSYQDFRDHIIAIYNKIAKEGSTTIPDGSTLSASGSGGTPS